MATMHTSDLVRLGQTPGVVEYLKALWVRREFAIAIPTAELQAQHRNTMLGGLWHLLNPLLQVAVYWFVFGAILNTDRGLDNFLGFLAIGVFTFHFTTKSVTAGAKAITNNEGLIRAIMFPRAILPVSVVLSEFLSFAYAFVTMMGVVLATGEEPAWVWPLVVPIVLLQLLFNVGVALFVARVSDHFRDFQQVLPFMIRLWFYMSGVIWPAERFLEHFPEYGWVLTANPAYVFVTLMRVVLLDGKMPAGNLWLSATLWASGALVLGFLFFKARENEYGRG